MLEQMARQRREEDGHPCTPKRKRKSVPALNAMSPKKQSSAPKRVQSCRPVHFGQPKQSGTLLARAGAPVITEEDEDENLEPDVRERMREADKEMVALDHPENGLGCGPRIRRKQHKRRKQEPSAAQMNAKAMKQYMAKIGATYPAWQSLHCRPEGSNAAV